MRSKPLKVIVYIRIASKSAFGGSARKTEAFLHTLFLENEAQTDQNNYATMLFMSKQVSLPKTSSILQKVKIGLKPDIRPFCTKAFNSQLQKRESTGVCFLYWLDCKSKHFNWNFNEWKATQPSLRVFSRKLSKWEPCKSCKIPYKPLYFCGLAALSILGDIWRATILPFSPPNTSFYSWFSRSFIWIS